MLRGLGGTKSVRGTDGRMKILVPVKRVVDFNVKVRVKSDGSGRRPRQRQDVDEPLRRDRRRGGGPPQGAAARRPRSSPSRSAAANRKRRSAPRSPWAPTAPSWSKTDADVEPLARRQAAEARGRERRSPISSSWASRRSTTIAISRARCSRRCSAGRKAPSPRRSSIDGGKVEVVREVDGGLETAAARSCRRWSPPTCGSTSRATPRFPTS